MIEISTPTLAVNRATTNLFYYRNATSRLQLIRVDSSASQRLEKVIFPGEQILFYANLEAFLEIHISIATGLTLVDRVPCFQLQVLEEVNS